MPDDVIEVRAKTQAGSIQTFRVQEIVSINGEPFSGNPAGVDGELLATLNHLDGRLTALENLIGAAIARRPEQEPCDE